MPLDRVTVYLSSDGWRWRRKAPNGEVISQGESYTTKNDAWHGAKRANEDLPVNRFSVEDER